MLIVVDVKIPHSPMDMSLRQKQNREILELTVIMSQIFLIGINRAFHLNTKEKYSSKHVKKHSLELTVY